MQSSGQPDTQWNLYQYRQLFKERAVWLLQVGYMALTLLMKTNLHNHAKAVSYSALPLLLFIVYLTNTYLVDYQEVSEAFNFIMHFTHLNFLNQSPLQIDSGIISDIPAWLCIIAILWLARGLFKSVQNTISVIFADSGTHGFFERMLPLTVAFVLFIIIFSTLGNYLTNQIDYSSVKIPFMEINMKFISSLISLIAFVFGTWGAAFLLYYLLPRKRPVFSSALLCSLLFIFSTLALIAILGNIMKMDYYSRIYGMLGEFVYVLIWIYLGSILFFFWAVFLYVSGKIDIFVLEKIFLEGESLGKLEHKIEHYIFNRSGKIFRRYGQHFKAGESIIRPNDSSDSIYFLYSGQIGFYRKYNGNKTRIGELKEGEIFSEMADLIGGKHTGAAEAESECFLFILSPATFEEMMSRSTSFSARIPARRVSIVRRKSATLKNIAEA